MKIITTLALFVASVCVSITTSQPAAAATGTESMMDRIQAVLASNPGGVQTGWNEVSWDDGAVILTLAPDTANAAVMAKIGNCASGQFCAYTLPGYLGNKLAYSVYTSNLSVAPLHGVVMSIANSRASGTVTAYNGTAVMATVAAGTGKNIAGITTSLSCS